jgi:DNA-binding CsgD family transcriptional regulator
MGVLDKALELALQIGGLQRVGLVRSARAEAAWLSGDLDGTLAEASAEFEMAVLRDHRWLVGILAFWRWRAGELTEPPDSAFEPFALQIAGNWRDAAARWQALGASYETASALADSDGEAELRYALSEFTRLGAQPMAARVARKLRSLGATSIARGPRLATRAHPSGLTGREAEVMRLMADGMTNAQIAEVMFVSTRTIEHHVSSILTKLNANSRHEAVARYRRTRA